jgi:hypothetical protein
MLPNALEHNVNLNMVALNFPNDGGIYTIPLYLQTPIPNNINTFSGIQTILPVCPEYNYTITKFPQCGHMFRELFTKCYIKDHNDFVYLSNYICLDKDLNIIFILALQYNTNEEKDIYKKVCYVHPKVLLETSFFYKGILKYWLPALIKQDYEVIFKDTSYFKQNIPFVENYEDLIIQNLKQQQNYITTMS